MGRAGGGLRHLARVDVVHDLGELGEVEAAAAAEAIRAILPEDSPCRCSMVIAETIRAIVSEDSPGRCSSRADQGHLIGG